MVSLITFQLGGEEYAIEIERLISIVDVHDLSYDVGDESAIRSLLQEDWPDAAIVDLAEILNLPRRPEPKDDYRYFVVEVADKHFVFAVDKVAEFLNLPDPVVHFLDPAPAPQGVRNLIYHKEERKVPLKLLDIETIVQTVSNGQTP